MPTSPADTDPDPGQERYDRIKERFAAERDLRLAYRPEGTAQYVVDLDGDLSRFDADPYGGPVVPRQPIEDTVEVLFIGGGFSALLTAARLRQVGVESIRIVERAADVGGTWYWNRYPGVACDVVSYDYLPLLDEMEYVPSRHYARGEEIFEHCRAIARRYDLYDLATFQTVVTTTVWDADERMWHVGTDRGDRMRARFVVCANGLLTKPKLPGIKGMDGFAGRSFHTSRWDHDYTGADLEHLADKRVGIIGTGATAVQVVPALAAAAQELYVFQRTPSSIDVRDDWETDPEWAASLAPGWQAARRAKALVERPFGVTGEVLKDGLDLDAVTSREERIRRQENANIDYMMRIHRRIDEIVEDPATAEALKPWYMFMCKRPCFHNDYLPAFNRPNVHLVDTRGAGITEIAPEGPVFGGRVHELDLLIYATGFDPQRTGTWNTIVGEDGVELVHKYRDGVRTLLGIHTHGFPNLFIMGGQQASYSFNMTDVLQSQGEHIAACIDHARREGHATIDVTTEAEEGWVQEVIASRGRTNRSQECTPGYYNFEGQAARRQDGNYNGSFARYHQHMTEVRADPDRYFAFTDR